MYVENQLHERVEQLFDDLQETFMKSCENAPRGSIRRGIDRHGDTMLNCYQLHLLIDELEHLSADSTSEAVRRISEAAGRAIRLRGYLYFVGD
jgi:hypothetical protein